MKQESDVKVFKLSNGVIEVVLCNYGCRITSIKVPGKDGQKKNIVAGYNSTDEYKNDPYYLGCTVGRFANRIAFGKFKIDGKRYQLECNDGLNHLHGGTNAFHKQVWNSEEIDNGLVMHYLSKDGEEGYPGNLKISVKFSFAENNKFVIEYSATTDIPTIINLTNHSYFNLTGFSDPTILDHSLKIYADSYTIKNSNNIPSGKIAPVANGPYDFQEPRLIGKEIDKMQTDMGYDINYVLTGTTTGTRLAAELYESNSGRMVKVFTDQPGLQVYTANYWNGKLKGQQGVSYQKHGAIALEAQAFPDAPNHPDFPDVILRPGEEYQQQTVYQFLTIND